jgi:hypothetical protein
MRVLRPLDRSRELAYVGHPAQSIWEEGEV